MKVDLCQMQNKQKSLKTVTRWRIHWHRVMKSELNLLDCWMIACLHRAVSALSAWFLLKSLDEEEIYSHFCDNPNEFIEFYGIIMEIYRVTNLIELLMLIGFSCFYENESNNFPALGQRCWKIDNTGVENSNQILLKSLKKKFY